MAYYDFDGKITIDEAAARRDIQKIETALPYLYNAKKSVIRIREEGSSTIGETGKAIVEKAEELTNTTNKVIEELEKTKSYIEKVVRYYQQLDREVKEQIQKATFI